MLSVKLLLFILYVSLHLSAAAVGGSGFRHDYSFNSDVEGWLKLHRVPATWGDARLQCDLEGAVLASPTNNIMLSAMLDHQRRGGNSCIFTGVHDTFSHGNYLSVEGVPLFNMPVEWAENEPNNELNGEHCIVLTDKGTVADVNCTDVFPFICYKKRTADMIVTECGTVDKKYKFHEETRSCYKFHHILQDWPAAYRICAAEGAYLAIVNSDREANLIKNIAHENVPTLLPGDNRAWTLLGFYKWTERRDWYTVDGTPLKDAGYMKWGGDQPDRQEPVAYGAMGRYPQRRVLSTQIYVHLRKTSQQPDQCR